MEDLQKNDQDDEALKDKGKLLKKENRFQGFVGLKTFYYYMREGGHILMVLNISIFVLVILLKMASEWWVTQWAGKDIKSISNTMYPIIYMILVISGAGMIFLRAITMGYQASVISVSFHNKMVGNIIKRTMSYFDTTPMGLLLNRFTKDIDEIDIMIPQTSIMAIHSLFQTIGALILLIVVCPIMLVFIVIIMPIFYILFIRNLKASTELRRLLQLSYSPILSNVSELINGLTTISVYKQNKMMDDKYNHATNLNISADLHEKYCLTQMTIFGDYLISLVVSLFTFTICFTKFYKFNVSSDPAQYALALTWALSAANFINVSINTLGQISKGLTSVQRVRELTENSKDFEKSWTHPKAPENWPSVGKITGKNVSVSYRAGLPLVLDHLDYTVNGGEKVGVIGRTGSGKSTMVLALLRIMEMSEDENTNLPIGQIFIDGIDIAEIGLYE